MRDRMSPSEHPERNEVALEVARVIVDGFNAHYKTFRELSRRAKACFEGGDWNGAQEASRARIQSYDYRVRKVVGLIKMTFPSSGESDSMWAEIKREFAAQLFDHQQPECAETFYNSVACGVLTRRYYRNEYIFFRPAIATDYLEGSVRTYRCYYATEHRIEGALYAMLEELGLSNPFQDLDRDVQCMVRGLNAQFGESWDLNFQIHVLSSLFYRNKAAYLVGRIVNGDNTHPFVVPILRDRHGDIFLDALLLDPRSIGLVFSLARAYFLVDMEVPSAYVTFLRTVIPTKSRAEIYIMLGLQKQGKTLFYRDLQQHLVHSSDSFVLAPGQRGMVMAVFTLPSFPYVFKIIRDWFEPPKDSDRTIVREKYLFVKYHDRVGRMSDMLEYSNVGFPKARFSSELRKELTRVAPSMVEEDGDTLVIRHLYIERRMVPLDMYLTEANETQTRAVLREFGNCIRELTCVNVFPGDLPLKNFGVTRYGKVIFYDYDEIGLLTDINFRMLPQASNGEEEMAADPWFMVGPNDVFPEEFPRFLFRNERLRSIFMEIHHELATVSFWKGCQERVREQREESVYPYPRELQFRFRFPELVPSGRFSSMLDVGSFSS